MFSKDNYFSDEFEQKRTQVLQRSQKELEFNLVLEIISGYTYSELGRQVILSLSPKSDYDALNFELDLIQDFQKLLSEGSEIPFDGLNDTINLLNRSKIAGAVLSSSEVLSIKDNIKTFRLVKNFFVINQGESSSNILKLLDQVYNNRLLEKHIEDAIDDNGLIKDNATKELLNIRTEIKAKTGYLRNKVQKILKKTIEDEIVSDDFYSVRDGRFVIPINVSHKRKLPGIIHGISQTGTTVYIEPSEIIETNNELSLLQNEEQREIYRILEGLTAEIGSEAEQIIQSTEIFANFDSFIARAKYANELGGFKPVIRKDSQKLVFFKIYHPLLIKNLGKKNTTSLSISFQAGKRGHLISGPNAGGKTVALKSVGLNLLMAISGIFPIGECEVALLDVFTSIGDHQSILNNLSTFSSQVKQLKDILDYADSDTLILIDEICSGTDPQEGGALAQAILDLFIERNMFFVVTTHQSSLKTYALNKEEIENASLEFDEEKLKPTYNFLSGVPGNSYAFHLSESVGISKNIIRKAKSYLGDKQNELENSIAVISKYRTEISNIKESLQKEQVKLNSIIKDYEIRSSELKAKKKSYLDEAKIEASNILNNANKLVENTIREIRETAGNDVKLVKKINETGEINNLNREKKQTSISEIRQNFDKARQKLNQDVKEIYENSENNPEAGESAKKTTKDQKPREIKVGDKVKYTSDNSEDNSYGIVLELHKDTKNAVVEFNGLKFKIKVNKLVSFDGKQERKKSANLEHIRFDGKTQLDVRGFRADEAIKTLDTFISDSILSGVRQFTLLHGKGTGALRSALQEYLKYHFQVTSFRDGRIEEGGAGVTIVEL